MRNHLRLFSILFLSVLLCGCSLFATTPIREPEPGSGTRGSTRQVLRPEPGNTLNFGNTQVSLDASHSDQGYVMVKWRGAQNKLKLRISGPKNNTYTYNLEADGEWHVFPLTEGSGNYTFNVFENVYDDQYSQAFGHALTVLLSDDRLPYLYPNEYVDFDLTTRAVSLAEELSLNADSDLDVITSVFYYVVTHLEYDHEKAASVQSGYKPVIDRTLEEGKGICFDYAALMTCMLRSQQIPTRLDIGYYGDVYHAWISTWLEDEGWMYNIIEFNGSSWNMMDPTFTSTASRGSDLSQFIGNDSSYFIKFSY